MQSNSLVVLSIALAISTTCTARADDRIAVDGTSILYNGSTPPPQSEQLSPALLLKVYPEAGETG
jgi:hypothetical protein